MELKEILESLVFATEKPVTLKQLQEVTSSPKKQLEELLDELKEAYQERGVQLVEVGGGYQFRTHPDASRWVKRLLAGRPQRMTRPMMETLAIVAYQQPVTRPEIEQIRGVDCGGTLRVLLERDLIRIVGKREDVGRPLLYGTSRFFLEFFHLGSLKELPTLKEFAELSDEHEAEVEGRFGEEPAYETPEELGSDPIEGPLRPEELGALAEARIAAGKRREALAAEKERRQAERIAQMERETAKATAEAKEAAAAKRSRGDSSGAGEASGEGEAASSGASEGGEAAEAPEQQGPTKAELEAEEERLLSALDDAIDSASSVLDRGQDPRPPSKPKAAKTETQGALDAPDAAEPSPSAEKTSTS
ncbi:MAG: SMC-Scp complex subunit ScpB [Deltaproteobacteria bacterium]|nr:MAG: SMC-Scp complex subunit ScpB [Pseudomonadota bacterium]PIE66318.1 MAG: SMC-Scp complex subunit ScpB [Deltaproteobacteria bacterium]